MTNSMGLEKEREYEKEEQKNEKKRKSNKKKEENIPVIGSYLYFFKFRGKHIAYADLFV